MMIGSMARAFSTLNGDFFESADVAVFASAAPRRSLETLTRCACAFKHHCRAFAAVGSEWSTDSGALNKSLFACKYEKAAGQVNASMRNKKQE